VDVTKGRGALATLTVPVVAFRSKVEEARRLSTGEKTSHVAGASGVSCGRTASGNIDRPNCALAGRLWWGCGPRSSYLDRRGGSSAPQVRKLLSQELKKYNSQSLRLALSCVAVEGEYHPRECVQLVLACRLCDAQFPRWQRLPKPCDVLPHPPHS